MIEYEQIKALNLRIDLMKCLINNSPIESNSMLEFLQLNEFNTTESISKADALFEFALGTFVDNDITVIPNNIDFKSLFGSLLPEGDPAVIDFLVGFLKFHVEDDINLPIVDRLEHLLSLECENIPNNSTAKRLFYYSALTLALAQSPVNFELIEMLNEKLKLTL